MFIFETNHNNKDCLVLFLGQYDEVTNNYLKSEIQNAYLNNLVPEIVFILFPKYISSQISDFLNDQAVKIDIERYTNTPIIKICFNEKGEIEQLRERKESIVTEVNILTLSEDIIKDGYKYLVNNRLNDIIVKAPSGTTFVKPSGKSLDEFIYASQLTRNSSENQFVAFSLLSHCPNIDNLDEILIDTSSISSIAEAVIYYLSKFKRLNCKHITYKSYSSYTGMDKYKPENSSSVWVIISASASTSMGKKIVKDWNLRPNQVVTILSFEKELNSYQEVCNGNAVVFSIYDYKSNTAINYSPMKVQIQGESFAVEVSAPRKIVLKKSYKPKYIDSAIHKYSRLGVYVLNKNQYPIFFNYEAFRTLYINEENKKLSKGNRYFEWIKQIVLWYLPSNIYAFIVPDGSDHKLFLEDFKSVVDDCGLKNDNIEVISNNDFNKLKQDVDGAIIVLSSVISSGRFFIDVNRELRLANHKGMRIFVTPFTLSPNQKTYENVKNSITTTFGGSDFKYSLVSFEVIYVGDKSPSSWSKELEFLTNLLNDSSDKTENIEDSQIDFWSKRKYKLERSGTGLGQCIGVHYRDADEKFAITPGFVYWPESCNNDDSIHLSSIFVTIASILQNIRDNNLDGVQLTSNIYQHCVIDPENFVRFNDPILQSALWRAATPSEMDYRRSDLISNDMQRILKKIFIAEENSRGVTSLDFLIAIAIGWIKLADESLRLVINDAEKYLKLPHAKVLINYIKKEFKLT